MGETQCGVHKLVTDVAALGGGKVLLVRYRDAAKYDGQRGWFLPDDHPNHGEHPRDAAKRILQEQTGIAAARLELSHVESFANGAWHIVFHYRARLAKAVPATAGENVADARWFPMDRLPPKKEVSHGGWATDVLKEMLGRSG